jgi:DNA-binding beta-propeller fold protein YncE
MVGSETVIGKGLPERTDPSALVVGPTGVGLSHGKLFVANSAANAIDAISSAMTRSTAMAPAMITKGKHLNDPLGMAVAPNGHIVTANGNDGKIVETTSAGKQVAVRVLDSTPVSGAPAGSGTLFGLAVSPSHNGIYFVDDGNNTLNLFH